MQQPQSRERVRANAQAGLPSPLRRSPAASRPCGPLGTDKEAEPLALQTGEPCGLLGTCSSCISLPPATDVRTCKCPASSISSSHREGARRLEAPLTGGGLEAEQRGRGRGQLQKVGLGSAGGGDRLCPGGSAPLKSTGFPPPHMGGKREAPPVCSATKGERALRAAGRSLGGRHRQWSRQGAGPGAGQGWDRGGPRTRVDTAVWRGLQPGADARCRASAGTSGTPLLSL